MKDKLQYLLLILFLTILPSIVFATTSLSASTQNPTVGSEVYIQIKMDYGELKIKEAHLVLTFDPSYFELEELIWTQSKGTYTSEEGAVYIDKTSLESKNGSDYWSSGGQVVLKFKILKEGSVSIKVKENGESKYADGNIIPNVNGTVYINSVAPNSYNQLRSLYVENYTISPTFNKSVYDYYLTVPADVKKVNVVATKADDTQTITGTGTKELEYGQNRVRVEVTAQDGSSSTYEIMITRTDNRTGDVTLKSLSVSSTTISYEEGTTEYSALVSRSISSILITARTTDSNATITGTGQKKLEIGENKFELLVTSSGGKEQTYTITITRSEEEFDMNIKSSKLINLNVNNLLLDLSDNKTTFLYGVENTIDELDITTTTESTTATVAITGNQNLTEGFNPITITVTEINEEKTIYTIIVYKNPSNTISTSNLNISTFKNNYIYQTSSSSLTKIPASTMSALTNSNQKLYYSVVNTYNGLLYQLVFSEGSSGEVDPTITKSSTTTLTYNMKLPKNTRVTLYLDDVYKDGNIIKIYTYDTAGQYTLLTDGIKVDNGYVTFSTNGQENYVFTTISLVKEESPLTQFIKNNILIISIIIGILILITAISIVIHNKKKKEEASGPLY